MSKVCKTLESLSAIFCWRNYSSKSIQKNFSDLIHSSIHLMNKLFIILDQLSNEQSIRIHVCEEVIQLCYSFLATFHTIGQHQPLKNIAEKHSTKMGASFCDIALLLLLTKKQEKVTNYKYLIRKFLLVNENQLFVLSLIPF